MATLIRSTRSASSPVPAPVRWGLCLAAGVVVGLAVGFAVGLARPRTWTYGPYPAGPPATDVAVDLARL